MARYKTEMIDTMSKFLVVVENVKHQAESAKNYAELLFRGQNVDKPLLPKLARLRLNGTIEDVEKLILAEFERGVIPLSEFKPEDDWDLLALAQHHGLPTRLLDWTYSPLIALWFAVNEAPQKDSKGEFQNGVVWILSGEVKDFRADTEKYGPLSNKITKFYRPKVVSRRISAQAGAFTVHKVNEGGRIIKFENHGRYGKKLSKVIIPHSKFASIRSSLKMLGINNSTVFPDLDGFCKYLKRRFSKLVDE